MAPFRLPGGGLSASSANDGAAFSRIRMYRRRRRCYLWEARHALTQHSLLLEFGWQPEGGEEPKGCGREIQLWGAWPASTGGILAPGTAALRHSA
jgi:hypothetical protein